MSGHGSQKAVSKLTDLIATSDDLDLRLNAVNALVANDPDLSLGKIAKAAIPHLLRLAVKRFDIDPRRHLQRELAFTLFGRNGLITIHGIEDLPADILLPAIREFLTLDDGRARGAVGSIYPKLKAEDRQAMWPDIYRASRDIAPSGIMFADQIRSKGLELMAEHGIEEGVSLTIAFMSEKRWGQGHRRKAGLSILKEYGAAAKMALPLLEEMKSGKPKAEELAEIEACIKAIKTGKENKLKRLNLDTKNQK